MRESLLARPEAEQIAAGYYHTVREILQQPVTWKDTASRIEMLVPLLRRRMEGCMAVVFSGSGSSEYASICAAAGLGNIATQSLGGGQLLTHGAQAILPIRPCMLVSLARSGNSPESSGALRMMLDTEPEVRHLVITCNKNGRLATDHEGDPRVSVITLDDRTNDRSLVMTSSFTNLVLAGRILGMLHHPAALLRVADELGAAAGSLFSHYLDDVAAAAQRNFDRVVYLASGSRFGAAREAALKMLEMTNGRIVTMAETYLGLRHGPMSAIHSDTAVVCFLSSDPVVRLYESDLIRELNRKRLGAFKILVGAQVPADLVSPGDLAIDIPELESLGDHNAAIIDVVVGQIFAFFRCLFDGLRPDSPSADAVISRVVESFPLHR